MWVMVVREWDGPKERIRNLSVASGHGETGLSMGQPLANHMVLGGPLASLGLSFFNCRMGGGQHSIDCVVIRMERHTCSSIESGARHTVNCSPAWMVCLGLAVQCSYYTVYVRARW